VSRAVSSPFAITYPINPGNYPSYRRIPLFSGVQLQRGGTGKGTGKRKLTSGVEENPGGLFSLLSPRKGLKLKVFHKGAVLLAWAARGENMRDARERKGKKERVGLPCRKGSKENTSARKECGGWFPRRK